MQLKVHLTVPKLVLVFFLSSFFFIKFKLRLKNNL